MVISKSGLRRCRRIALARALAVSVCAVLASSGCGAESAGEIDRTLSDREQVEAVVMGFFEAVARDDVSAVCGYLSPAGRGAAIAKSVPRGSAIPPVTRDQCVEGEPVPGWRGHAILVRVLDAGGLQISKIDISGHRARAIVSAGYLHGVQRLSETAEGWRIDRYHIPLRD